MYLYNSDDIDTSDNIRHRDQVLLCISVVYIRYLLNDWPIPAGVGPVMFGCSILW